MSDNINENKGLDEKKLDEAAPKSRANTLDDESRVKVLSPGMLVFKRFIRNKLAITGFIILVVMFAFSFLGGLFSPYTQSQVFKHDEPQMLDYASATYNTELRFFVDEGYTFSAKAQAQFQKNRASGAPLFDDGENYYSMEQVGESCYAISQLKQVAVARALRGTMLIESTDESFEPTEAIAEACTAAIDAGESMFTVDDMLFTVAPGLAKEYNIGVSVPMTVASLLVYDAHDNDDAAYVDSYEFRLESESAIDNGKTEFAVGDRTFKIVTDGDTIIYETTGGTETVFVSVSDIIVNANANDVLLPMELKSQIRDTIIAKQSKFTMQDAATGEDVEYRIERTNAMYYIKTATVTRLITMYESPSATHLLGTDGNGMDVMTRLMYGGRISLLVGFVVVFIEIFLGVIIGGIAGYFGRWVDTVLMRFVDLFNSIPFYPIVMIIGAVMDKMDIDPIQRIFILMAVLGIMGWTGVARIVRGQILSLREQDFMIATECTGIRVSRRIFRHLVPNVMPLLIVQATMGLGGIIITEATLSFLGLGVKYPVASWGNIINAATNIHVMTEYWFIWIPAGFLIVLTVLGFNFVGDGLRDAFDPKMKR